MFIEQLSVILFYPALYFALSTIYSLVAGFFTNSYYNFQIYLLSTLLSLLLVFAFMIIIISVFFLSAYLLEKINKNNFNSLKVVESGCAVVIFVLVYYNYSFSIELAKYVLPSVLF